MKTVAKDKFARFPLTNNLGTAQQNRMTARWVDSSYFKARGSWPSNRPCAGSSEHCHSALSSP